MGKTLPKQPTGQPSQALASSPTEEPSRVCPEVGRFRAKLGLTVVAHVGNEVGASGAEVKNATDGDGLEVC